MLLSLCLTTRDGGGRNGGLENLNKGGLGVVLVEICSAKCELAFRR